MGREVAALEFGPLGGQHHGLAGARREDVQRRGPVHAGRLGKGGGLGDLGHEAGQHQVVDQLHARGQAGFLQVEEVRTELAQHRFGAVETRLGAADQHGQAALGGGHDTAQHRRLQVGGPGPGAQIVQGQHFAEVVGGVIDEEFALQVRGEQAVVAGEHLPHRGAVEQAEVDLFHRLGHRRRGRGDRGLQSGRLGRGPVPDRQLVAAVDESVGDGRAEMAEADAADAHTSSLAEGPGCCPCLSRPRW